MIPTDNALLFENDPQSQLRCLKSPGAKWPAPLTGNNQNNRPASNQPLRWVKDSMARI